MTSYHYKPVDSAKTEIRLLTISRDIKQVLGRTNVEPLSGTLSNHVLPVSTLSKTSRILRTARLPLFDALSYVWGDSAKSHEILLDGLPLAITENLYNGLRGIQKSSGTTVRVWADAICINQDDDAEKSAQILLMREVYHSASAVRIWVGLKSQDATRCLDFINNLAYGGYLSTEDPDGTENNVVEEAIMGAFLKPTMGFVKGGVRFGQAFIEIGDIIEPAGMDEEAVMLMSPDESYSLHQESIKGISGWRPSESRLRKVENEGDFVEIAGFISRVFLENPWFTRMWVVQEVGTASSVEFQIGGVNIDWGYVVRTIYYLHFVRNIPVAHIGRLIGLEQIRLGWNDRKRQSLWDLIRECRYRHATDPRDKIYSLFGLMGDKVNENLRPDYTKSIAEVYSNATRHFLTQVQSLDRLCGWERSAPEIRLSWNLPSWVPDYTLNQDLASSPLTSVDGGESIFAASGYDHRAKYSLPADEKPQWSVLRTSGIFVDSIAVLSNDHIPSNLAAIIHLWKTTLLSAGTILDGLSDDVRRALEDMISRISKYNLDSNAMEPSLDPNQLEYDQIIHHVYILDAFIHTLISGRVSFKERATHQQIAEIMNGRPQDPKISTAQDFQTKIRKAIQHGVTGRKLVITTMGHIGAVPDVAQSGDLVCVLYGCSVPVVLRYDTHTSHYEFIGECYLHGFMDAEAIALNIKDVLEERNFILN